MKKIESVAISGLGAIGSVVASQIHSHNPDTLRIIADSQRIARYRANGISVNGRTYSFTYIEPEKGIPVDLVIIAVKNQHLLQAIEDIRKFVGNDTIILSLLNGISSEEIIGAKYGMDKLLYSFVVGTDSIRVGTVTHFGKTGDIVFGAEKENTKNEKINAVKDFFDRMKISYRVPSDIIREQWWKFIMNVGINQCSAILRAPYGVFQKVPEIRELSASASREVIAIARKAGINLQEDDIDRYLTVLDTLSPDGKTSMLQDVEAGRKTEVEMFSETVMTLGKKYNVETPVNEVLFRMIRTLEHTKAHKTDSA